MLALGRPAMAMAAMARRPPSLLLGKRQAPAPTRRRARPSLAPGAATDADGTTTTTTATPTSSSSSSSSSGPLLIHASLAARPGLCDGGLPDVEMCLVGSDDDEMAAAAEEEEEGEEEEASASAEAAAAHAAAPAPLPSPLHVPPAADAGVLDEAASRGRWLVGLLVVQSLSSVVLERFEPLIREHLAVTLFLTMLVGAGGNAGNQSAIKVIRGLATGQLDASWPSARAALSRQAGVALVLGGGLAAAGYARVVIAAALGGLGGGGQGHDGQAGVVVWADASRDAAAIAVSLLAIVFTSILLGTALPFLLARAGLDAAHAGTTIQVASDVLGVLVTCLACSFFYSGAMDGVTDGIGLALAGMF